MNHKFFNGTRRLLASNFNFRSFFLFTRRPEISRIDIVVQVFSHSFQETMESNEDSTQWDPMREDYEDPKFNSYLEGPGNRLSSDLRVENIPPALTNEGLFNILSRFGDVELDYRSVSKYRNDECVAYVIYRSQIEANRAIKELHKEPPFFLKLRYTKSKEERLKEKSEMLFDSRFHDMIKKVEFPTTDQPKPDNIYDGPKFEDIQSYFFTKARPFTFITNDNFDPSYCNPLVNFHSNDHKIYPVFDELYPKIFETDDKKVTLGRRYFIEEEESSTGPETSDSFKFGESVENPNSGLCQSCSKKTSIRCKACLVFYYCSRPCQKKDWNSHKSVCLDFREKNIDNIDDLLVSLKVTHVESDHIYAVKMDVFDKFETLQKRLQEESPKQQRFSRPVEGSQCAVLDGDTNEWCRGVFAQVSAPVHKIFYSDYGFTKPCAASSIRCLHSDLTIDKPFALKIKLSSTNGYAVVPGSLLKVILLKVETNLYKAVLREVCKNPQSKPICGSVKNFKRTEFFGKTYAKIINLSSEEFTDVSVEGNLTASTYFVTWKNPISSEKLEDVSAYIKLDDDKKIFYPKGSKLRVRSVCRLASDCFCVEVESFSTLFPNKSDASFQKTECIIKWLKKNDAGKLSFICIQRNTSFLATAIVNKNDDLSFLKKCRKKLSKSLQEKMKELSDEEISVPEIGSCVAVYQETDGGWVRGIVWSVSDAKIARIVIIDFGHVISVSLKYVRPLDKNFKIPPSLTVRCLVKEVRSEKSFENLLKVAGKGDLTLFDFTVEEELSTGAVRCSLKNDEEEICLVELSEWSPTVEEVGLRAVQLRSKMEVKLTQFYSLSLLYVTPVDQANFIIDQKLVKFIQSSKPMYRMPRFGELVACKWSKNNHYHRAQILEPFEDSQYRIFFVDFGTQEIRTLEDVFELDDELKSYPCLAIKICLKDISSELLVHPSAVKYLNSVGFKEESLKIVFENNDLSAVELCHLNNINMNKKLNDLLKTEDIEHDDETYHDSTLYSELKIGANVEFGVLRKCKGQYMMLLPKSDAAQFVFDKFHDLINEHCENLTNKAYYPRENEVVFAQINSEDAPGKCWCRAVVLQNRNHGSARVQPLDFSGDGEILRSSIRKMHPKFMHVPAVAYEVTPKLPQDLSSSQVERIDSFFNSFSTYSGKVISGEDFHYCVDFKFLNDIIKQF